MQQLVQLAIEKIDLPSIPPTRAGLYFGRLVLTPPVAEEAEDTTAAVAEPEPKVEPVVEATPVAEAKECCSDAALILKCVVASTLASALVSFGISYLRR